MDSYILVIYPTHPCYISIYLKSRIIFYVITQYLPVSNLSFSIVNHPARIICLALISLKGCL